MAWTSLGEVTVTVAGTPVRATNNLSDPTLRFPAHAIAFQQVRANTGKIIIQDRQTPGANNLGRLFVLAVPTANSIPSVSAGVEYAPAAFNLSEVWIDADIGGEKCLVSCIQA